MQAYVFCSHRAFRKDLTISIRLYMVSLTNFLEKTIDAYHSDTSRAHVRVRAIVRALSLYLLLYCN